MARAASARDREPIPEADRLEDFPHPRHTEKLFGHEEAEHRLARIFTGRRMHHAWLIGGAKGIGKATLAYRLAGYVLADASERLNAGDRLDLAREARTLSQLQAMSHPGLMVLRKVWDQKKKRFSTIIPVDEIRRLRQFLTRTADQGHWRVVIVDSADDMNLNAANALLKSLEEPPPNVLFLLLSAQPGRLLPTIRSRCHRLDLAPLASDPLRRAALQALQMADMGDEDADLGRLEPLAAGSVRKLLVLRSAGGLPLYDQCHELLTRLPHVDWPAIHKLADEISSPAAAQRFNVYFDLLAGMIARALRAGASGRGTPADLALARQLIGVADKTDNRHLDALASWAALWETIHREQAESQLLNLDRKALVLDIVGRIEQLARAVGR